MTQEEVLLKACGSATGALPRLALADYYEEQGDAGSSDYWRDLAEDPHHCEVCLRAIWDEEATFICEVCGHEGLCLECCETPGAHDCVVDCPVCMPRLGDAGRVVNCDRCGGKGYVEAVTERG